MHWGRGTSPVSPLQNLKEAVLGTISYFKNDFYNNNLFIVKAMKYNTDQ